MKLLDLQVLGDKRKKGVLPAGEGPDLPVWIVEGDAAGPTLVLTAGVHGCEYVGILTLRRLFQELSPREFRGRVLLLPLLNPGAFHASRKWVVPADGKNLNRVFPPPEQGTRSQQIARCVVEQIYPEADFLLDLHGGDVNEEMTPLVFFPSAAAADLVRKCREAAACLEVDYRVPSPARNGLYSNAAQCGIPSLVLEMGGLGLWDRELVERELRSIRSLMGALDMGPEPCRNPAQREPEEMFYATAAEAGFWFPACALDQPVRAGDCLGVVEDLDGRTVQKICAPFAGRVLYQARSLGVEQDEPLAAFARCP